MPTKTFRKPVLLTDRSLLTLLACVFTVFLVTGVALPALPVYIHEKLGFGEFTVGLVSGAQFAAALLFRLWAGKISDQRGPKFAVISGLVTAAVAGMLYLVSLMALGRPLMSVGILIAGRALLGGAESLIMIGAQSWSLALGGRGSVGKMLAWIGTAMFLALALGAPLGSVLFAHYGFKSIGMATSLGAVLTLLLAISVPAAKPASRSGGKTFATVLKAVWLPGLGMAFSSLGYGMVTAFAVLLFVQHGWQPAWLSFTMFAVGLMVARVLFGSLPDHLGGARTAMIFIMLHSVGLALVGLSHVAWLAFVGATLAGFGYALIYPGFGMEAVARAPANAQGVAMGVYTAFIDLALGVLAPLLGLVATLTGIGQVFVIAAGLALCAVPIAAHLRRASRFE